MGKQLRVLHKGNASVPVFHAHASGARQFVGMEIDESKGTPYEIVEDGVKKKMVSPAYVPIQEPTVIDQDIVGQDFGDYLKAVREGDLWPADEATARMCGAKFDPDFGGEYAAKKAATQKAPSAQEGK